ncbi:NnrS family protein [Marinospirillum perlucidum]|uniref:NnrS family protein n=1 Tax=Marinospirillum perlucidum TaxID=1982602 RepID=UPI000DF1BFCE|nr:NnrS family protein [Marinospirillum perlucidum]
MRTAVFNLGFRPFFILGSLAGSGLMLVWVLLLSGQGGWTSIQNPLAWHRHEMIFGYAGAILAGFLLTAVRRWTGKKTPDGWPLALLALVWLGARLMPLAGGPLMLYALLDLIFWAGLWVSLWPALKDSELSNRVFLLLIAGLFLAALASHGEHLGHASFWLGHLGAHLGLDLFVVILLLVAGRILPFFIQLGLQVPAFPRPAWLEKPLPFLFAALLLADLLAPFSIWSAAANILLAVWMLPRLWIWHHPGIWKTPLLWSLYLAFIWLLLGLVLRGLGMLELINPYMGIHALGVGGLGLMTLSMMSRISLGHTGRPLKPSPWIVLAFALMLVAALVRVFATSSLGLPAYHLAATCWSLALLIFVLVYTRILISPRPDGQPG